jgi:hypothetical protein
MKVFHIVTLIGLLLFSSIGALNAQSKVCLDNTEQFSIASKYVTAEKYVIQVGLPIGYSSTADWLMWNHEIKEIIVIGISYGQGMDAWWNKRARDFTPSMDTIFGKDFLNAGGADNFIKFIKNELFPLVTKSYRTNPDSSAISGLSFGGLLNSYILFTQPEMFQGYIIIAPMLVWNNKSILKLETEYFSSHKELNKTVYISYGSLDYKDWVINATVEFISMIKMHNYQGLKFVPKIFEGETHISVLSTALTNGLKTIFLP